MLDALGVIGYSDGMQISTTHNGVYFMSKKQGVSYDRVTGVTGCRQPTVADHQRVESMFRQLGTRRLAYDSGVAAKLPATVTHD